jgi:hypothetical protein
VPADKRRPATSKKTAAAKKRARATAMSDSHKRALANGRTEGRIIRDYLDIVEATKPRRGRRRTPESITRRLHKIANEITFADALTKVRLVQERLNLTNELKAMKSKDEIAKAEAKFVKVAKSFSKRNDISWQAWTEFGVSPVVLKKAGITPE